MTWKTENAKSFYCEGLITLHYAFGSQIKALFLINSLILIKYILFKKHPLYVNVLEFGV